MTEPALVAAAWRHARRRRHSGDREAPHRHRRPRATTSCATSSAPWPTPGCRSFIVHARNAWLKGCEPEGEPRVPPLRYEDGPSPEARLPGWSSCINGGVRDERRRSTGICAHVDGVMVGPRGVSPPLDLVGMGCTLLRRRCTTTSRPRRWSRLRMVTYMAASVRAANRGRTLPGTCWDCGTALRGRGAGVRCGPTMRLKDERQRGGGGGRFGGRAASSRSGVCRCPQWQAAAGASGPAKGDRQSRARRPAAPSSAMSSRCRRGQGEGRGLRRIEALAQQDTPTAPPLMGNMHGEGAGRRGRSTCCSPVIHSQTVNMLAQRIKRSRTQYAGRHGAEIIAERPARGRAASTSAKPQRLISALIGGPSRLLVRRLPTTT